MMFKEISLSSDANFIHILANKIDWLYVELWMRKIQFAFAQMVLSRVGIKSAFILRNKASLDPGTG